MHVKAIKMFDLPETSWESELQGWNNHGYDLQQEAMKLWNKQTE